MDPAATVTVAGTVTSALLDVRDTTTPPAEAARDNVTVPVDVLPPATVVGETETLWRSGVSIVSGAV